MSTPSMPTFHYTNQFGEQWEFQYNPVLGKGRLRGSDIDWEEHDVVQGRTLDLILSEDELEWLRKVWNDATEGGVAR